MAEELKLRRATAADSPAVEALIHTVLREYGLSPDPAGTDADLKDLARSYAEPEGLFVVLEDAAGRIRGTGALIRVAPDTCEVRKMYFEPALRGQGWGKALLAWLLDEAARRGHARVRLETAGVLHEAVALYRAFGFRPLPADPRVPRCDQAFELPLSGWRRPAGLRALRLAG